MEEEPEQQVIGQDEAVIAISKALRRSRADLPTLTFSPARSFGLQLGDCNGQGQRAFPSLTAHKTSFSLAGDPSDEIILKKNLPKDLDRSNKRALFRKLFPYIGSI